MKVATVVVMVYVSPAVSMHIPAVEGVFMRPASRPPRQHTTCSSAGLISALITHVL